jgi:predicted CopG family antitoxin
MKKTRSITIEEGLLKKGEARAKKENRSFSNLLETLLKDFLETIEQSKKKGNKQFP